MKIILIGLITLTMGACATAPHVEKRTPAQSATKPAQWIRDYNYNTEVDPTLDSKGLGGKYNLYDCTGVVVMNATDLPSARLFAKTDGEAFIKYVELLSQPADSLIKVKVEGAGNIKILAGYAGENGGVQIKCFLIKQL